MATNIFKYDETKLVLAYFVVFNILFGIDYYNNEDAFSYALAIIFILLLAGLAIAILLVLRQLIRTLRSKTAESRNDLIRVTITLTIGVVGIYYYLGVAERIFTFIFG